MTYQTNSYSTAPSSATPPHPHAKISIQSVAVSSATWQIDFLMKNPSSRYSIYYDEDDTTVNLGPLNAAVLNITRKRDSRDQAAFSLAFLAEKGNSSNDVVSEELDIKLRAKHKRYTDFNEAGHFNIRCQNLTRRPPIFNRELICFLDIFAHSVSVSNANANVSTADWRIGLIAKSPVTGCKISLHTIKSRLLRGHEVISELSPSLDGFGQLVTSDRTDEPVTTVHFNTVVTPGVIGGVVWDYRVEIVAGFKGKSAHGFLMMFCGGIPVKFTADAAGNMVGSLLGRMRRCDYLLRDYLNLSV
ncbi:hypothetical protein EUTSA_v10015608mg [Eutrema salsugineum]|uniref:Uncharacterized protein n=1 Tax=Eutrema salsugineum TaxID=72664 RepID=V4LIC6_EUTSA|nr:hypothetical protein EUTSA_v10015608mg [Eutrema salsugineum]